MSTQTIAEKLGSIIGEQTQKKISQTGEFLETIAGKELGEDTVTFHYNSEDLVLNREDYEALKIQTSELDSKQKEEIKAWTTEFKVNLMNQIQEQIRPTGQEIIEVPEIEVSKELIVPTEES